MGRNIRSSLVRRRRGTNPMAEFDRLPPPARDWLRNAVLPWSPRSVRRLWDRALRESAGDIAAALSRMDRAECKRLARERRGSVLPPVRVSGGPDRQTDSWLVNPGPRL
ncbi:DUF6525 family protein [Roseobacter sp. AzwK-3b]|uniref:DUF6525 family protein n=1 Tax=Roseobacter sp. AzwK-3b TaxID=351016 RepID=UPI001E64E515|nr:DUF6525 family protein [Roseobacter sp. AzwK-3b]